MNPFDDWLQRLLGQQQQQPSVGPVQPQINTQQPFSAPTAAPEQDPSIWRKALAAAVTAANAPGRVALDFARQAGRDQASAWNALMGQQLSAPSQNWQAMTPEQQMQVQMDMGGLVNPMATIGPQATPFFRSLFSRLQRGIQDAPVSPKGASAKEWLGLLTPKTAKGEREFTGIQQLLESDPARVITKNELDELAKKKGVQFSEVVDDRYGDYIQPGDAENYRMIMLTKEPSEEMSSALKPFQDSYNEANAAADAAGIKFDSVMSKNLRGEGLPSQQEINEAVLNVHKTHRIRDEAKNLLLQKQEELLGIPYQSHNNVPKNTLAHLRLSDRIDPVTGQKTLFVEELQSDMLQELRDYGPIQGTKAAHDAEVARLGDEAWDLRSAPSGRTPEGFPLIERPHEVIDEYLNATRTLDNPNPLSGKAITKKPDETLGDLREWMLRAGFTEQRFNQVSNYLKAEAKAEMAAKRVPGGQPFTKGEEWTELLLKRVLKEAVDGGYESVILPRGSQVSYVVGGPRKAMAQYYETNVPNILKDYGKKLGVKIEMEEVPAQGFLPAARTTQLFSQGDLNRLTRVLRNNLPGEPNLSANTLSAREFNLKKNNSWFVALAGDASDFIERARNSGNLSPMYRQEMLNKLEEQIAAVKRSYEGSKYKDKNLELLDEAWQYFQDMFPPPPTTMLTFRITPDLKSAVSKGQRLWSTGAAALPGTMELLRQRNGLPKREEKKKK